MAEDSGTHFKVPSSFPSLSPGQEVKVRVKDELGRVAEGQSVAEEGEESEVETVGKGLKVSETRMIEEEDGGI